MPEVICTQARTVLWYLTFIGFAVNYMIRINLNITIVEMVVTKPKNGIEISEERLMPTSFDSTLNFNENTTNTTPSANMSSISEQEIRHKRNDESYRFHWDEYAQGLSLGAFYWAHWITQIPGGLLAKKYGTKLIFGSANVLGCWSCFLIPVASFYDYKLLILLRVFQGLITGLAWPAMHVLTANWIPPDERSKFVTAYLGGSVGIAIFYPLFGYIMHWLNWQWVYYICGLLGTIWWCSWLYFVYDSPAKHPRISVKEREYIENSLGSTVNQNNKQATPWRAVFKSAPLWVNVIAQWGGVWGLFTLMTQAPTYFRFIHNMDIKSTGLLSGLPHLMRRSFAYVFSIYADYLIRNEKMSRTNVRKLATTFCCIIKGLMVLGLAFFGYDVITAIVFLTLATMVHGAVSSGPLASLVDLAPNHAGVILGISGMVSVLPGFISPYIVGIYTLGNQTFEAWRCVFIITAVMLLFCGLVYVIFADSNLQSWNDFGRNEQNENEIQLLHGKKNKKGEEISEYEP